ncbi:MAG: ABC transporter ATP-binding protein [Clostridia bacterium]
MLKVENIKKSYGVVPVLKGISIEVKCGEVYGLIGANGAGKTTLMNIISQISKADEGSVFIDDKKLTSINDLSGNVGYMLDIPAMFEFMTAYEYFEYLASPMGKSKEEVRKIADKLLKEVALVNVENKKIKGFSRGMKQRMGIAAALVSNPKVVLMDEPSSALDPQGRHEVLEIIESLRKQGKIVILSTHILNDVEKICDKVGLLVGGKIVVEGKISDVLSSFAENAFNVECETEENLKAVLQKAEKCESFDGEIIKGNFAEIKFKPNSKEQMFKCITSESKGVNSISLKTSSIETIFLKASQGGTK